MKSEERYGDLVLVLKDGDQVASTVEENEVITLLNSQGKQVIPEYCQVGLGYHTAKGKFKVTNSVPSVNEPISTNLYKLLSKYDVLYAIDTNKKVVNGVEYCISNRMHLQLELFSHQYWELKLTRLPAYIFTNPVKDEHEEKIGWRQFMYSELLADKNLRIGLVTDHDLGFLPLLNRRQKEISGMGLLPENIELIYASADRDKGSPLNKAVMSCDADSNLLLKQITQGKMNLECLSDSLSSLYEQSGILCPKYN
ncbi:MULTISPECIES: hypothetical protein [Pseudoalteromonas]|uniref:hypothetical protein n=1 Tax=Pseudoalteromonas TaxID=53246 RepID=UPI0024BC7C7C|nr:hypothetical protein [Pseudoalteromonas prydzensis]